MFTDFFYVLKNHGLNISTTEWLMLMDALDKDLAHSNFTDFYYLCRTILVKSEGDYDKFDIAFQEYFNDIKDNSFDMSKIDAWLHNDVETGKKTDPNKYIDKRTEREAKEVHRKFEERLGEQKTEHHGGTYWIGMGGGSEFGKRGHVAGGMLSLLWVKDVIKISDVIQNLQCDSFRLLSVNFANIQENLICQKLNLISTEQLIQPVIRVVI